MLLPLGIPTAPDDGVVNRKAAAGLRAVADIAAALAAAKPHVLALLIQ